MSDEEKREKSKRLLQEGRKRYLAEHGRSIRELDELLGEVAEKPEQGERIYRILHTIKGSAPVFGLFRSGAIAEEMIPLWAWAIEGNGEAPLAMEGLVGKSRSYLLQLQMECDVAAQEDGAGDAAPGRMRRGMLPTEECRLLVIDDDEVLRSYTVRRLQLDGYQVDEAANVTDAKRLLRERKYDLVTLDLLMLPQSGFELFAFLKEDPSLKWLPLIVLSGRSDIADKVRCFELGADDYVTKPFEYEELSARIYRLLLRAKNFEQLAFRDPLTGAYNRRYFDHQLDLELQRAARDQSPLSLAFIDIDRFKTVNDMYGHHVGDSVLQGLAYLLQQRLRATDLLARFGGEEFVVLMPGASAEAAVRAIREILDSTNRQPIAMYEGRPLTITFSAGVAQWVEGESRGDWIRLADEAMYAAKQQGRNRVVCSGSAEAPVGRDVAKPAPKRMLLLAADDAILRSIVSAKLRPLGVGVLEAKDGEEAWQLLAEQPVQVAVIDGIMPKLDGFTLLQRVHADERLQRSGLKVLLLSDKKREEDVARAVAFGADDYMAKPFSLVELEIRVKRLLGLEV